MFVDVEEDVVDSVGDIMVEVLVGAEKLEVVENCVEMIGDIVLVGIVVVVVGGVYTVDDVLSSDGGLFVELDPPNEIMEGRT